MRISGKWQSGRDRGLFPILLLDIATLCSLCRQNMGVTFCSEMYARQMGDTSGLTLLPMADDLSLGELMIAYPDGPAVSPVLRDFVELAAAFFAEPGAGLDKAE